MLTTEKRRLWQERISEYRSSGITCKQFCQGKGYSFHALRYWIHKFNNEPKDHNADVDSAFVQLLPDIEPQSKTNNNITLVIGEYQMMIPSHFDEKSLIRLVTTLKQC